ncbi:MAG TPA: thiamine pyrophosphate-dependent enzyme, partial [Chitinophagaceae bacterium]|nr:thiamine pyrophosphate-dependent enzyme [Chitinophagaceae bacterium]
MAGDFRSGYYRDQTFMFASGMSNVESFFAQLYANPDVDAEPSSAGRQMNGHYGTRLLDANGQWKAQKNSKNSSSDISPTAGQMVRGLGLAFASKLYRSQTELHENNPFSDQGNEVCFTTIGDASTSEGLFWETVNAASVMQVPLAVFVWDDGYGISVPRKFQTTKNSISEALQGFQFEPGAGGMDIYTVKGWDYPSLVETFRTGIQKMRNTHVPALFHVQEVTQPQGHSTSGSHERYKSKERLEWEKEMDCIVKMKEFILENAIAGEEELKKLEEEARQQVQQAKQEAWTRFLQPIRDLVQQTVHLSNQIIFEGHPAGEQIAAEVANLQNNREPLRRDVMKCIHKVLLLSGNSTAAMALNQFYSQLKDQAEEQYSSLLYSGSAERVSNIQVIPPRYDADSVSLNGFEILNKFFDHVLQHNPRVFAFGEDVGQIGDVNQGFAGLQD